MGQLDRARKELNTKTSKSAEAALAAARKAVEDIGSVGTTRLRIADQTGSGFSVAVKPTVLGAAHGSGRFDVSVTSGDDDKATVRVRFTDPVVTQSKLLGFIPMGPKSVMGLKAYERALTAIGSAVR